MKRLLVSWALLILHVLAFAQKKDSDIIFATIENGDTVGFVQLAPLVIRGDFTEEAKQEFLSNKRLAKDLKKVMPFAKVMGKKIVVYNATLDSLDGKRDEKRYIREESKKLRKEFEGDMKKLNVRQGKLLIKLIHRETGNSGYELLETYKGKGTAIFWHTFASVFGASLKAEYDKKEEQEIEFLISYYRLD